MKHHVRRLAARLSAGLLLSSFATIAVAQTQCGGDFRAWRDAMVREAGAQGVGERGLQAIGSASVDQKVLQQDRAQGVFTLDFAAFAERLISQNRLDNGAAKLRQHASVFERVRSEYGVAPEVIAAFWGLETDFGGYQGDFNTLNAIATLAHDCRRPHLFRPQLIALGKLIDLGVVPADITGAWAGEIGQVQVLPEDYLTKGRDGDGDGKISLKTSAPDAIVTAANFLRSLGWRPNEPWLVEVDVPAEMDWSKAGIHTALPVSQWQALGVTGRSGALPKGAEAHLLLPMGRKGPAFLAYPNFRVFLEWNQSLTYVTTAAYFATRLGGAPRFDSGNPDPGLDRAQMKGLQQKLAAKGYDVGEIDGILGAGTRDAVRSEQQRLGLPADAWPTAQLLNQI
ncbi:lytic murein transglycosylase [Oricola cellulosilytica]|uniref:Lytic murein transglycosylase n=1 Tax=Oricola cellulosilytica TaxID=1429082 RepID=A0A4R0PDD9_9HYPH|nr:lytic murein transglycosylase [Oricola cellulosilytica]TCD14349.1 lytic murein transglycosylase [Oricola cellulosilytica]